MENKKLKKKKDLRIDVKIFHLSATKQYEARGNTMTLPKLRALHQLRANSFAHRVINSLNSLSESVILAPSVNAFKNRLDKHWDNLPSLYDAECLN